MSKVIAITILALLPTLACSATAQETAQAEKSATALRQRAEKGDANAALLLGNLLSQNRISAAKFGNAADWYRKGCALRERDDHCG